VTTFSPDGGPNRRTRRVGLAATLAVIGLTFAFVATPAVAVTRTPYNTNLIKNPSFEAGSATGGYRWISVPYWSTYGKMTVVKYGAPNGFPSLAEGARISGGKKFFTMGTPPNGSTTCSAVALQSIPIRRRAAAIDAGRVQIDFRLYMGTYDSQPDTAVAIVNAYASSGALIDETMRISTTQTNGEMRGLGGRNRLPAGTRTLRVLLLSQNTQGYCDAYFDRIRLVLSLP
jgi:hypothetical protein